MNGATVFLITFFTSIATSCGTVYLIDRLHLFEEPQQETVLVPNLEGLSETQARASAERLGLLVLVDKREASATEAEGTVLRQSLPSGQMAFKGERLSLTLAKAVPLVPTVMGMDLERATDTLQSLGYEVRDEQVDDADVPAGQIVSQRPLPGVALAEKGVVTLGVSAAVEQLEVPRLLGFSHAKATEMLKEQGFEASVRWTNLAETGSGVVLNQVPKPGEKADRGSTVQLVINRD